MTDDEESGAPVKRAGRKKQKPAAVALENSVPLRKAPGPRGCRRFARARLAEAMPALVGTLIEQSQGGSLGHMRLLVQLSGLDEPVPAKRQRADGTVKALMDEWHAAAVKREG